MKVKSIGLEPLERKHYTTKISISVEGEDGQEWQIGAEVYGYCPNPWEHDYGIGYGETDPRATVVLAIVEALKGKTL